MRSYGHHFIALFTGITVFTALVLLTINQPLTRDLFYPGLMFWFLIVFSMTFGVPLGVGFASLTPMVTIAAYLVLGPLPGAWIVFLGACAHGLTRQLIENERSNYDIRGRLSGISLTGLNAGVHTLALLVADAVYTMTGGTTPLAMIQPRDFFSLVILGFTYLGFTYLLIGLFFAAFDRAKLSLFLDTLPRLVIFESYPLVFAPLAALIYVQLGALAFLLFAVAILISTLITRNLAFARQRLERRVKELGSLQAVGHALSASLNLEEVLNAIHTQVSSLMPADNFLVALKNPQDNSLTFPLVYTAGEQSRQELTQSEQVTIDRLLTHVDRQFYPFVSVKKGPNFDLNTPLGSRSWLSVPLLAAEENFGIIVTGTTRAGDVYDQSHQEILTIIAAQAALAIQNARLYARTDETLARRVQELDSILLSVGEGVLLVDLSGKILAANPSVMRFLGLAPFDYKDLHLGSILGDESIPLIERIGYSRSTFLEECQLLNDGLEVQRKARVILPGPPEREVERTLTPVLDRAGMNTGWLFVFRDLGEERELERLRDEMMHMLIHDLRSPLATLQGSIAILKDAQANPDRFDQAKLIDLAQKSNEKVLNLVEGLLEIHQLEGGQMPLNLEEIQVTPLLHDSAAQLEPLTSKANIRFDLDLEDRLPAIRGDPSHFGRILDNLLDNAYKFTPDGGCIQFEAAVHRLNDRLGVLIRVSDSGPGIPKNEQEVLFKQVKPVTTQLSRRQGTGLGLRYCRLAVEAQGGRIWVESSVNQGSSFYLWFPVIS